MVRGIDDCVTFGFVAPGVSARFGRTIPPARTKAPCDGRAGVRVTFGLAALALFVGVAGGDGRGGGVAEMVGCGAVEASASGLAASDVVGGEGLAAPATPKIRNSPTVIPVAVHRPRGDHGLAFQTR